MDKKTLLHLLKDFSDDSEISIQKESGDDVIYHISPMIFAYPVSDKGKYSDSDERLIVLCARERR